MKHAADHQFPMCTVQPGLPGNMPDYDVSLFRVPWIHFSRAEAHVGPGFTFFMEKEKSRQSVPTRDDFVNALYKKGIGLAVQIVKVTKPSTDRDAPFSEPFLNQMGYNRLYFRRKPECTIPVFELMAERHPESANARGALDRILKSKSRRKR